MGYCRAVYWNRRCKETVVRIGIKEFQVSNQKVQNGRNKRNAGALDDKVPGKALSGEEMARESNAQTRSMLALCFHFFPNSVVSFLLLFPRR
jgi:hypothetical protein